MTSQQALPNNTRFIAGAYHMKSPLQKKIVVLESDQLINAGVYSFLSAQDCYEVFGLDVNDPVQIYQSIELLQPDVIILDKSSQITNASNLITNLERLPKIRTIVVSVSSNQIQVCDKQDIVIHRLSEFLEFLD